VLSVKIDYPSAIPFSQASLVCRQNRLGGTIGGLVMVIVLAGAGPLWRYLEAPSIVWGACVLLALLVAPMIAGNIRSLYRPENWTLVIEPAGVWVHLRSPYNWHFPEAPTALFLQRSEIASVRSYRSRSPERVGVSRTAKAHTTALEIELAQDATEELVETLCNERQTKAPERKVLLGITVRSKSKHYPVTLPETNVLRIDWRSGRGDNVTPALSRVIAMLDVPSQASELSRSSPA